MRRARGILNTEARAKPYNRLRLKVLLLGYLYPVRREECNLNAPDAQARASELEEDKEDTHSLGFMCRVKEYVCRGGGSSAEVIGNRVAKAVRGLGASRYLEGQGTYII